MRTRNGRGRRLVPAFLLLSICSLSQGANANPDLCYYGGAAFECVVFAKQNPRPGLWIGNTFYQEEQLECKSFVGNTGPWECYEFEEEFEPWVSSSDCTTGTSAVGGDVGGFYAGFSLSHNFRTRPCGQVWNRPAGHMAVRIRVLRWGGNSWSGCADSGWYYNSGAAWLFGLRWDFGNTAPCGPGYYGLDTGAFAWNGAWRGGWGWSGFKYVGTASAAGLKVPKFDIPITLGGIGGLPALLRPLPNLSRPSAAPSSTQAVESGQAQPGLTVVEEQSAPTKTPTEM